MKRILFILFCFCMNLSVHAQDADIWKKYTGQINDPNIPVLPDYSYAGYKLGMEPIPDNTNLPVFDVANYGAIPDDSNDDQQAIQDAIDAAEANGGGVVFFPPGEFLVNTDTSNLRTIRIQKSNIVLKGSGSTCGGTKINMVNHMRLDANGGVAAMFSFIPTNQNYSGGGSTLILEDVSRGGFVLKVQNASIFQGYKYIKMEVAGNQQEINERYLDNKLPRHDWENIINRGVILTELHEIESIDVVNNTVTLKDPVIDDVTASHGWRARQYEAMENCGFRDIHFMGNFYEPFNHHLNYIHDQGWNAISMIRMAHSYVTDCRFSNVNNIMGMTRSYACSIIKLGLDGNNAHGTTSVGYESTRILQGLYWDNTTNGQLHGTDFTGRASGCVAWRIDAGKSPGYDLHANQPRTNLIDLYHSDGITGNGGWFGNQPNHLTGLTIWNQKRVGNDIFNYDYFDIDCGNNYCGVAIVSPIIVGMHGSQTTFFQDNMGYEESNGVKVSPESLYEAQMEERLGYLPAWVSASVAEFEGLKSLWSSNCIPFIQPLGPVQNLALNKPAQQSSNYSSSMVASKANNEVLTDFNSTLNDLNAWWEVDLESPANITSIDVINRTNCCQNRLNNFYVFVSDIPFTSTDLQTTLNQPGVSSYFVGTANPTNFFSINRTGQYVRVQLQGQNFLHMAEVVVNGTYYQPIVNLALNKPAQQSSNYATSMVASKANNEVLTDFNSTLNDLNAWWEVDLENPSEIRTIDVRNRTNCCQNRLNNFYVFVSDVPFTSTNLQTTLNQPGVSSYFVGTAQPSNLININRTGEYVRVQLQGQNYLHMAEVIVSGNHYEPIVNLALDKPAQQSSNYSSGMVASKANNEVLTDFNSTLNDLNAWWEVDLENPSQIIEIDVRNRTNCCQNRLDNFYVFVSSVPFTSTNLQTTLNQSGVSSYFVGTANPSNIININRTGQYVRVQLQGQNYLHMAEVIVSGRSMGTNRDGTETETVPTTVIQFGSGVRGGRGVRGQILTGGGIQIVPLVTDNDEPQQANACIYACTHSDDSELPDIPPFSSDLQAKSQADQKTELNLYVAQSASKPIKQLTFQYAYEEEKDFKDIKVIYPTSLIGLEQYDFIHEDPKNGNNYYQAKVEYMDGTELYSNYRKVAFTQESLIAIAPNPAREVLNIDLSEYLNQPIHYFISTVKGKVLMHGEYTENHRDIEMIDLAEFQNGSYIIYLRPENHKEVALKFIVLKN